MGRWIAELSAGLGLFSPPGNRRQARIALIQRLIPVWAAAEGTEAMGETVRQGEAGFAEGPLCSEAVFGSRFYARLGIARRLGDGHFLKRPGGRSDASLTAFRGYLRSRDPIEAFASTIRV